MKIRQLTKQQNRTWAYWYLGFAVAFIIYAFWKKQYVWNIFALVLIVLAGWRLYWVDKKLKDK